MSYDTEIIPSSRLSEHLPSICSILAHGEIIAFPTETVYGIGADIFDEAAVRRIFEIKGRNFSNPMAAHISSFDQIDEIARNISPMARKAIEHFMPGPISIILPKRPCVPDIVTAGFDTVGIRFPKCDEALSIISAHGRPLAATSANLSGSTSAKEISPIIRDFSGKIAAIVDAGNCAIGVESTVISFAGPEPKIFRLGAVSAEEISDILQMKIIPS